MRKTADAFVWIITILKATNIKFQISGGLAARVYGAKRELADIDIEIADSSFGIVTSLVKKYIIYGPAIYKDSSWKLKLMTLKYKGQIIDIAGEAQIFDKKYQEWVKIRRDFSTAEIVNIYGVLTPVINRSKLLFYKKILDRGVDKKDVASINNDECNHATIH